MKKKNLILRISYIVAFLVLFGLGQSAWAQTNTWNGSTGDGLWGTNANWALGVAPTALHDAVIPADTTVTIGVNSVARSITLNSGATLIVNDFTLGVAQSGTGAITLNGNSSLTFNGTAAVTIGNTTYRGNIVMNDESTLTFAGIRVLSLSGTWTKAEDATITLTANPSLTLEGTTSMSLPESLTALNLLDVDKVGGTVTLSDDLALDATLDVTNGTLIVGDNNFTAGGATTINAGATLNANYTDEDAERTFAAITLNGTLNSSGPRHTGGTNNTMAAITFAATGVLNVANSITEITTVPVAFPAGATITATGADLTYSGVAFDFSDGTINTNSNTDLTLTSTVAANLNLPSSITNLHSLTINSATGPTHVIVLSANLTIAQNLTLTQGTLTATSRTIVVNGSFTKGATANAIINLTGANATFNGAVDFGVSDLTAIVTTNATSITFGGTGAIANFPATDGNTLNSLTYNRTGETLTLLDNATAVVTFAGTTPTFNITSGTVLVHQDAQIVTTATTTTTIGANGTLDLSTTALLAAEGLTFNGTLTGTGTILADNGAAATAPTLTIDAVYSFTGNLVTDAFTDIVFSTAASGDVSLNSSVTDLNTLTYNRTGTTLTLNNDLTIAGAITATEFALGTINVNGYRLTFEDAFATAAAAALILDAADSELIFVGAAVFNATATYNIDETTNLEFRTTPTLAGEITECNNLVIEAGVSVDPEVNIEIFGNLTIIATGDLDLVTTGVDAIVRGDISNLGTMDLTGQSLTVYGSIQGEGTYTTDDATTLVVEGTGSQLVLPFEFGEGTVPSAFEIGNITLNRPSGMKLNNNLTVGAAATEGLTITNGDLDLNGYVIALAAADASISETAGNTIINTGASGEDNGYITTLTTATTQGNIEDSGIGVTTLTGGGNLVVRRYPKTVPVPGVGLSTSRIFNIANDAIITALTFQYDNTELYSPASDLQVFVSEGENFAVNTNLSEYVDPLTPTVDYVESESLPNEPSEGFGQVVLTQEGTGLQDNLPAGTYYFALAALPGDGGVMRTFAVASGNWSNASNWSPAGVPTKVDQVVIQASTITVDGEGQIYEFKTLNMAHPNGTIQPANTATGDVVTLRGFGNITLTAGAEILGVNGTGRINLEIGDGASLGVSSTFSVNNDYVTTSGMWIQNFAINGAEVSTGASFIRVSGDVTVGANSELNLEEVEFWGGYDSNQLISVENTSSMTIDIARFDNNANVTTTSNLNIDNHFLVKSGSSFNATGGTAFFAVGGGAGTPWNVENNGTLKFFNVEFNSTGNADFIPQGTAYIQGNFWQYNDDAFAPESGKVVFSNTSQFEIVNSQDADDLVFYVLEVAAGSGVKTSSDFQISHQIDVKQNASLIADYGTISFVDATYPIKWIKNASTQTLEFNNLTLVAGTTYTNDSWKIKGDLLIGAGSSLLANNGTITFENFQEKEINAAGTLRFFKLRIADGAKVTTETNHNFTIANNATYPTGAGIEVLGNGEFYVGVETAVTTFNVVGSVAAGNPKVISKSADGKLEFGLLTIAATNNNEVTTSSDFTITAVGALAFNNEGAGGKFTATAGTVTFTGAAPEIRSVSPAVTQFYSISTEGTTALTYPNADAPTIQEFLVAGDITIDDQSSIVIPDDDAQTKVIFNGDGLQTIGGNSLADPAIAIPSLVLNKANNSHLLLNIDLVLGESSAADNDQFVLTNGILNLGSSTLTVYSDVISRSNGAIYGNEGTYVIGTNHQTPKLEDVYFTIDGVATLYNLTVDEAHTIANDLTVNGTLNLNLDDLTIGDGADANNPMKLIVYGDLTRATGEVDGSLTVSRLVLTGTGTVIGGLTNDFFTGAAATTVQLEIARQETLGGDLDIAATSYLIINNSVNEFDIDTYTLTLANTSELTRLSGGIKADAGEVVFGASHTTIPGNLFIDDIVNDLTIAVATTLGGNLIVNGILSGVFDITTNDNVLTFGSNATLPAFTDAAHVIGNLRRYVNNQATTFYIGGGTAGTFSPVTLQFANTTTYQPFVISSQNTNPVYGRGGNATRAINSLWSITPEGTAPFDSLKVEYGWGADLDNSLTETATTTFPAKWENLAWTDYRSSHGLLSSANFVAANELSPLANRFPYSSADAMAGDWALFVSESNTDASKDSAIAVTYHRLVVTDVTPNPVVVNFPFTVTVELQDRFGNAVKVPTADGPYEISFDLSVGANTLNSTTGFIQVGQSSVTLPGFTYGLNAERGIQFTAEVTDPATTSYGYIMPGISPRVDVLDVQPGEQVNTIVLTTGTLSTTLGFALAGGLDGLIMAKAGSAITEAEFPVDGVTYFASRNFGEGSTIGDAVVVYKGTELAAGSEITIYNLAPNTTYYFRGFAYDGANGTENYRTTASSGNPRAFTTTGGIDDDVTYGTNNSFAQAKAIGTNTTVRGTIKSATDEDWFSFTVTNGAPNIRTRLELGGDLGNYNIEVYDRSNNLIRRGIRLSNLNESPVVNELPAGTYVIRIFGVNEAYNATSAYVLTVKTSSDEIFSVTE